jgi:hypothetical protein
LLIVSPPLYETGLLGIANHQLQCGAIKVDVAPDAFGSPPRMRAVRTQAVELGDERRRELDPCWSACHSFALSAFSLANSA